MSKHVSIFIWSILAVIITYPDSLATTVGVGIDPSLIWVFNYVFAEAPQEAQHFLFPHGV